MNKCKKIYKCLNIKCKFIIYIFAGRMPRKTKERSCQTIIIPPNIIDQVSIFKKNLNQLTVNTVNKFLIDRRKSKFFL